MKHRLLLAAGLAICSSCANAADRTGCAAQPIAAGYGADGTFDAETAQLANPGDPKDMMTVYFPKGAKGPRPVVFFGHGFGPGFTATYADFLQHMVSKGYVVVFSTYPMTGVTIDQRYDALWQGFEAAAAKFGTRMDLTRVAFVGHSFGGGSDPAMAYHGLVEKGWGKAGAFLMELAPWYSYQLSDAKLAALPAKAVQFIEVYDDDAVNDHRMAIDLYNSSRATDRFYVEVRSDAACGFKADHATPGRNEAKAQRQYAVFRPFDALADWVWDGDAAGRAALERAGGDEGGYQPMRRLEKPEPNHPETAYRFPWANKAQNPRFRP